jgi:hypothetical protein
LTKASGIKTPVEPRLFAVLGSVVVKDWPETVAVAAWSAIQVVP